MRVRPYGHSARGGLSLSRRRLLAGTLGWAAGSLLCPFPVFAGSSWRVLDKWPTGNLRLSPFTLDDDVLYLNGDVSVEAWQADTGKRLWQQSLPAPMAFRPRLTEKSVVTSGRSRLSVWDRTSGENQWSYTGAAELGVPLVQHGRIHCGEGHRLITLDADSGEPLWRFDTVKNSRIAYAPIGRGNLILLGPGDGFLYCLSRLEGRLLWKVDRESQWQYLRQLSVTDELLVAGGYHDEIYGIDIASGEVRWRFNAGNFINSQLVTSGAVYFWSPTGWVYALDAASGSVRWRHRTIDYRDRNRKSYWAPIMAEMVADDEYLYVLAMDHVMHILDRVTGNEVGSYQIPDPVRPFVCLDRENSHLFLGSAGGEILHIARS